MIPNHRAPANEQDSEPLGAEIVNGVFQAFYFTVPEEDVNNLELLWAVQLGVMDQASNAGHTVQACTDSEGIYTIVMITPAHVDAVQSKSPTCNIE